MALTSTYMPETNTSLPKEGFMVKAKDFSFSKSDASSSTSTNDENCAIERMTTGYKINSAKVDSAKTSDVTSSDTYTSSYTWTEADVAKISADTTSWIINTSDGFDIDSDSMCKLTLDFAALSTTTADESQLYCFK